MKGKSNKGVYNRRRDYVNSKPCVVLLQRLAGGERQRLFLRAMGLAIYK